MRMGRGERLDRLRIIDPNELEHICGGADGGRALSSFGADGPTTEGEAGAAGRVTFGGGLSRENF